MHTNRLRFRKSDAEGVRKKIYSSVYVRDYPTDLCEFDPDGYRGDGGVDIAHGVFSLYKYVQILRVKMGIIAPNGWRFAPTQPW